jgi:hypothetical protein
MLTLGMLRHIVTQTSAGDDTPVLIRTRMVDGTMQADDINDIGMFEVGRRQWSDLVLPGVPNVTAGRALIVSTLAPVDTAYGPGVVRHNGGES